MQSELEEAAADRQRAVAVAHREGELAGRAAAASAADRDAAATAELLSMEAKLAAARKVKEETDATLEQALKEQAEEHSKYKTCLQLEAAAMAADANMGDAGQSGPPMQLADAQRLTQAAGWERFYYSNSFYASDFKKDLKLEPATWAVLLLPLAFAWLSRREARAAAKVSAEEKWLDGEDSDAARGGGRGFGASAAACAALLLAAFLYVDILSGFLHVVLDNPAFATWPLIGPGAVGFQRHHHHPMGITVYPLANFVQEHLGGMALFMATGLVPAKWSAGARTPELRLFLVVAVALSCAMMASHRWSHTMPSKLAPPVRWLWSQATRHSRAGCAWATWCCPSTGSRRRRRTRRGVWVDTWHGWHVRRAAAADWQPRGLGACAASARRASDRYGGGGLDAERRRLLPRRARRRLCERRVLVVPRRRAEPLANVLQGTRPLWGRPTRRRPHARPAHPRRAHPEGSAAAAA